MKAIAYASVLPLDDPAAFFVVDVPKPQPAGHELLVRVQAVSVNPVDAKVRRSGGQHPYRRLGWDVAGIVEQTGPEVGRFAVGDHVYYCGPFDNPTHAQWHAIDERMAGHMPQSMSFAQAAALPLTVLTAWESLFHALRIEIGRRPRG